MRLIFGEQTSRILEPSPQGLISSIIYGQSRLVLKNLIAGRSESVEILPKC